MSQSLAALIIGNEILSGRRTDAHLSATVAACNARGLRLSEVVFLGDDDAALLNAFARFYEKGAMVLSFGGIGATPDDKTRQAVAQTLGVPLIFHPDGLAILERRFGEDLNDHRRRLVEFPQGAQLIPNPINEIPGFSAGNIHCVPGFPQMAAPMIEWVLDRYGAPLVAERHYCALLADIAESEVIPLIEQLEAQFPALSISSLPQLRRRIELGFEGKQADAQAAREIARQWFVAHGYAVGELA